MLKQLLLLPAILHLAYSQRSTSPDAITKRTSEEVIFLSNCEVIDLFGIAGSIDSEMDWYASNSESFQNQYPDAFIQVSTTVNKWINWEDNLIISHFADENYFASFIVEDAASLSLGTYAGYGWNEYHNFNCFKDDERIIYTWASEDGDNNGECASIYYCRDAEYYPAK